MAAADTTWASRVSQFGDEGIGGLGIAPDADRADDADQGPALDGGQSGAQGFIGRRAWNDLEGDPGPGRNSSLPKARQGRDGVGGAANGQLLEGERLLGRLRVGLDQRDELLLALGGRRIEVQHGRARRAKGDGAGRKQGEADELPDSGDVVFHSLVKWHCRFAVGALFQACHGSRHASPRSRLASLVVDELVLLGVVLDLPIQEKRDVGGVACDVRPAGHIGVGAGLTARLDAIEEVAHVEIGRVARDPDPFAGQQGVVAGHQIAVVARLHPAGFALETDRAGSQRQPAVVADHQLDPVGIAGVEPVALALVLDRSRVVGVGPWRSPTQCEPTRTSRRRPSRRASRS